MALANPQHDSSTAKKRTKFCSENRDHVISVNNNVRRITGSSWKTNMWYGLKNVIRK